MTTSGRPTDVVWPFCLAGSIFRKDPEIPKCVGVSKLAWNGQIVGIFWGPYKVDPFFPRETIKYEIQQVLVFYIPISLLAKLQSSIWVSKKKDET